jgi:hypothetical protein
VTISSASRASARRISTFCCWPVRRLPAGTSPGRFEARPVRERRVATLESPAAHEAAGARLGAEEDVLRDREPGHERGLLRDRRDPAFERLARRAQRHRLAREEQLAGVWAEHAGHDPAERRLPGAVLADQRVDLPTRGGQRDGVEGAHAAEALGDLTQLDVRALRHYPATPATRP